MSRTVCCQAGALICKLIRLALWQIAQICPTDYSATGKVTTAGSDYNVIKFTPRLLGFIINEISLKRRGWVSDATMHVFSAQMQKGFSQH